MPAYIPGLYSFERQPIKVYIFDLEWFGILDPTTTAFFMSTSFYSQLRSRYVPVGPVTLVPIQFSKNDPSVPLPFSNTLFFQPAEQKRSDIRFQLGFSHYSALAEVARGDISRRRSRAAEQGLQQHDLQFISSGLAESGFIDVDSDVFALRDLRPGQKLQLTPTRSRLVAAFRGHDQVTEVVTLLAPSDDDRNCRSAHLAALSFAEALQNESHKKMWLLVIDRNDNLNTTMTEVRLMLPSSIPITLLRTYKVTANKEYYHDHAYVLWLMKALKAIEEDEIKVFTRSLGVASGAAYISTRTISDFPPELQLQIVGYLPELSKVALALTSAKLYQLIRHIPRFRYCLPEPFSDVVTYLQDTRYMESLRLMGRQWNKRNLAD